MNKQRGYSGRIKRFLNEVRKELQAQYPSSVCEKVSAMLAAELESKQGYGDIMVAGDLGKIIMIDIVLKKLDEIKKLW